MKTIKKNLPKKNQKLLLILCTQMQHVACRLYQDDFPKKETSLHLLNLKSLDEVALR